MSQHSRHLAARSSLALVALLAACERPTAPEPSAALRAAARIEGAEYNVRSLGTLGGNFSLALGAMSDIAVGVSSNSAGVAQAFAEWNGQMHAIGDGSEPSAAWAINHANSVALSRGPAGAERAMLLMEGAERPLGSLGGAAAIPLAVNDKNVVVGWGRTSTGAKHAFVWTFEHGMQDIGTLPGMTSSEGASVNLAGQVVGVSGTAGGAGRAFSWRSKTGMRDLGTLGGTFAAAFAINDRGTIVGYAATADESQHAVMWRGTVKRDLGTLGGRYSAALAVNASHVAVGYSETTDGMTHAFVWTAGTMVDLGTLPGGTFSVATAIQDDGRIAGYGDDASGALRAVVWYR